MAGLNDREVLCFEPNCIPSPVGRVRVAATREHEYETTHSFARALP